MGLHWLLEPEVFQGDEEAIIDALRELKVAHTVIKFGRSYEEYIADFPVDANVLVHSSFQFAELVRKTNWKPGVVCNLEQLDCQYYYPKFYPYLLNGDCLQMPFGELSQRKEEILSFCESSTAFVRPCNGYKSFSGTVVSDANWSRDIQLLGFYDVKPDELVVVARPQRITKEWRAIIAARRLVGISQYKEDGETVRESGAPSRVTDYISRLLCEIDYNPDPVWTLDIAEIDGSLLTVIEVGSFSCAGLYACDPIPVVQAIQAMIW